MLTLGRIRDTPVYLSEVSRLYGRVRNERTLSMLRELEDLQAHHARCRADGMAAGNVDEHMPRISGAQYQQPTEDTYRRSAITISTDTWLARATRGAN